MPSFCSSSSPLVEGCISHIPSQANIPCHALYHTAIYLKDSARPVMLMSHSNAHPSNKHRRRVVLRRSSDGCEEGSEKKKYDICTQITSPVKVTQQSHPVTLSNSCVSATTPPLFSTKSQNHITEAKPTTAEKSKAIKGSKRLPGLLAPTLPEFKMDPRRPHCRPTQGKAKPEPSASTITPRHTPLQQ